MMGELTIDEKMLILKRRLDKRGVNLSDLLDLGQQSISNWVCGRTRPGPKYKEKLIEISMGLINSHDFLEVKDPAIATDDKNKRGRKAKITAVGPTDEVSLPLFNGFGEAPLPASKEPPPPPAFPNFF
jgi:hypothetical protein